MRIVFVKVFYQIIVVVDTLLGRGLGVFTNEILVYRGDVVVAYGDHNGFLFQVSIKLQPIKEICYFVIIVDLIIHCF